MASKFKIPSTKKYQKYQKLTISIMHSYEDNQHAHVHCTEAGINQAS